LNKKQPLEIGITGGIGSGKSLVTKIFHQLGAPIYDADSHAKKLMTTDGILISQIKKEFGDLSYNTDGSLNNVYLANHVFHDEKKLQTLNSLVHPRVAIDYKNWVEQNRSARYVIKEAALLFEANSYKQLNKIIVVSAPEELRIRRVLSRDKHRTVEQIKGIVEKQMPEDEKLKRADYIIVNDETTPVIPQVLDLHHKFTESNN
jgi:dephospho-CoA kinase